MKLLFIPFLLITFQVWSEPKSENLLLSEMVKAERINNPKQRNEIAKLFYKECESLNKKIPNLSPKEEKWVLSEMSSPRNNVFNSSEFIVYAIKNHMDNCMNISRSIYQNTESNSELLRWAELASVFTRSTDNVDIIKDDYNISLNKKEKFFLENSNWYTRGILDRILIPLLNDES